MDKKLIILPGWGQHKQHWQQQLEIYPQEWRAEVVELPGFGNEPMLSTDAGIPEYASWLADKLAEYDQRVILLGHSFGGRVAAYLAAERASSIQSLILYGAPCLYRPSLITKLVKQISRFVPVGLKRRVTLNSELSAADSAGLGEVYRKVVDFDQTERLSQIRIPVQLLWGQLDNDVPLQIATEIDELIPNSELTVMVNVGHNAHLEKPYLFYGKLKQILEKY